MVIHIYELWWTQIAKNGNRKREWKYGFTKCMIRTMNYVRIENVDDIILL